MAEPGLFAIGCGVTFLFLGGAYIVLRSRYAEIYEAVTKSETEASTEAASPFPDGLKAVASDSTR